GTTFHLKQTERLSGGSRHVCFETCPTSQQCRRFRRPIRRFEMQTKQSDSLANTGDSNAPAPSGLHTKGAPPLSRARVAGLAKRQINLVASLQARVVRDEKPGPIHDLRVATRRLQQILDTLFPKPLNSKARKVRRTLRQARRSLSD